VKTKNDHYDVLKEIRRIRKKHYEETKNMSMAERVKFDRRKNERFREEISKMNFDYKKYSFPFVKYPKTNC
ncbi:MAG: hypothetical protein LBC68_04430, partial [Prevotellaceae bacterium]|jgi:hypothetical protein|nr:hypothetical protein [Prevotellaceae bacterium]